MNTIIISPSLFLNPDLHPGNSVVTAASISSINNNIPHKAGTPQSGHGSSPDNNNSDDGGVNPIVIIFVALGILVVLCGAI